MRSSQEIMEILKQTYPSSMRKYFDNSEDALKWINAGSTPKKFFEWLETEPKEI